MISAGWLAGWVACALTVIIEVALYNRMFGKLEERIENARDSNKIAHKRIDELAKEYSHRQEVVDTRLGLISENVATIRAIVERLEKNR